MNNRLKATAFGAMLLCAAPALLAQVSGDGLKVGGVAPARASQDYWRIAVAPYAIHFNPSPEHRHVWALALERQRSDLWFTGASYFSNSFGQPSAYLYGGRRFPELFGVGPLFGQVSGGLLYGYVGQFQNKVPYNKGGYSPGALLGLGWNFTRDTSASVQLFGTSGAMLQLSSDLR